MKKVVIFFVGCFFFLLGTSLISNVKGSSGKEPITWSVTPSAIKATAGDTVTITLTGVNAKERHIYGIKEFLNAEGVGPQKTEITIDNKSLILNASKIRYTKPKVQYDSGFQIPKLETHYGKVEFSLPVIIKKNSPVGKVTANVVVYYQSCDESTCLPPKEEKIPFTIDVDKSTGELVPSSEENNNSSTFNTAENTQAQDNTQSNAGVHVEAQTNTQQEAKKIDAPVKTTDAIPTSLWEAILWSIAAGFAAWFMPCVYPMIPITVSFFTKRSEKEKTNPIKDSIVYSLGIMSTYIILGVVLIFVVQVVNHGSNSGSESRNLATNPVLNMFLAVLFLVISGNLFGMYEIALPARLVNSLNRKSNESSGYSASFIMGMVFSLTSLTCTIAPISAIQSTALQGEFLRPLYTMTILSAVFALPFFLLALFPTVISKMPRSGGWMNNIKVFFGFIEIAFAVSYFARVDSLLGWEFVSREFVLAAWAGCTILIVLYMLGVFKMKLDSINEHVGGIRVFLAVIFAGATIYLFNGMSGKTVGELEPFIYVESGNVATMPSAEVKATSVVSSSTKYVSGQWIENLEDGFQIAKQAKRAIFVDFTGVSCTNCRKMEKNMFPRTKVQELMNQMVLVRCYTDRRYNPQDMKYQQLQLDRFKSTELPLYVILTPDDKVVGVSSFTTDEQAFLSFLQKGSSL
ncbi:MAG: cytochrome c biogenesis protein CcdA [Candidatus Kapaibacterium sp.]